MNMESVLPTKEEVEQAISINQSSVEIETNSTMEEVLAASEQGDNPIPNDIKDPRTFSLQPLCEAYKLAGGVSPQQREMSTQARVLESGVRDSEERVEVGAPLTESQDQAKPESLQAGFQRTGEVLQNALDSSALFLQREGNLTLSSQNAIRISSLQGASITGANTFLSTATTIINSQVSANASESIVNLSDVSITRVNGSSTTHVEDTNQLTTSNDIRRASETSQTIANRTYNHGIELNSSTGNTILSTAGSGGHTIHSSGDVSTFTDSSSLTLANEQITIGAGPSSSNAPSPQAEPDFSALGHIPDAASFVRIIAGDNAGITSVTSGDSSSVSKGSQLTSASNTYLSAAKTAAQVAGRELMNGVLNPGGNPQSHVFHQRKIIIQGRLIGGFPSIDMEALQFPTVPPLPPKPTAYTIEDLQACIPKSYRKNDGWTDGQYSSEEAREAAESLGVDQETIRRNAGSQSIGNSTAEVVPGETGTEQDIATTNSEITEGVDLTSIATGIAQMVSATSSGGGPTNVYVDMYEESSSSEEEEKEEESTAEDSEENILDSLKREIASKIEGQSDVLIFIVDDLYQQGYRGGDENNENFIKGTLESLREQSLKGDRSLIIKVMNLMDEKISSQAMGMFQDLGDFPSISLPQIGSVGQVIGKSFGLEDLGSIVDSLTDINSLEGLSSGALLDKIGLGDIDFSSIGSVDDLLSIVGDNEIADILKRESIRKSVEAVLGNEVATSIVPIIEQIINGPTLDMDAVNDVIGSTLKIEGLIDRIPGDWQDLLEPVISTIINGGEISLSNEEVLDIVSSIAGNDMPFKILSSYREVESIIGNVRALSSIPDLLNLMEDNDVPIISRASLLLSCLDVFNRVKSMMGSFESVLNTLGDINFDSLGGGGSEDIVRSALENIGRQDSVLEAERTELGNQQSPAPLAIPDSTDRRILLLGIGKLIESQIVERSGNHYLLPEFTQIEDIRDRGIYKGTGNDRTFIPYSSLPYYTKDEVAEVRQGETVIWSNPSWSVVEKEGHLFINRKEVPTKEQPIYTIPHRRYERSDDKLDTVKSSRFIESMPKVIQFLNLLDKATYEDIQASTRLGATQSEADYLTLLKASTVEKVKNVESTLCFPITKLDSFESEIEVISVGEGYITFRAINKLPVGINSLIQVRSGIYRRVNGKPLTLEESSKYYNPLYINYRVSSFSPNEKLGVARIETKHPLIMKDSEGSMYKYYTVDIGKKIFPSIDEAFLL